MRERWWMNTGDMAVRLVWRLLWSWRREDAAAAADPLDVEGARTPRAGRRSPTPVLIFVGAYVIDESARSVPRRDGGAGRIAGRSTLPGPPALGLDLHQGRGRCRGHVRSASRLPGRARRLGAGGITRGRAAHSLAGRQPEAGAALRGRGARTVGAHAGRRPTHPLRLHPGGLRIRLRVVLYTHP